MGSYTPAALVSAHDHLAARPLRYTDRPPPACDTPYICKLRLRWFRLSPRLKKDVTTKITMIRATHLLLLAVVVLSIIPCIYGGHLVHDFYKCSSDWYRSFFKRCKRNLDVNKNSAPVTGNSVLLMLLSVGFYYFL